MRGDPTGEQRPLVRFRNPLEQHFQPNLVDERLRNRTLHHCLADTRVIVQVRPLELRLEVIQRARQLIRDECARFRATVLGVFRPNACKLHRCVFFDDLLDLLDVSLVKRRGLAVFEDHEVYVLLYVHVSKPNLVGEKCNRDSIPPDQTNSTRQAPPNSMT